MVSHRNGNKNSGPCPAYASGSRSSSPLWRWWWLKNEYIERETMEQIEECQQAIHTVLATHRILGAVAIWTASWSTVKLHYTPCVYPLTKPIKLPKYRERTTMLRSIVGYATGGRFSNSLRATGKSLLCRIDHAWISGCILHDCARLVSSTQETPPGIARHP